MLIDQQFYSATDLKKMEKQMRKICFPDFDPCKLK